MLASTYAANEPEAARVARVDAAPEVSAERRLGLAEALALAESHSPGLDAAEADLTASRRRASAAAGRLGPRADLSVGYTRQSYVEPATLEIPIDIPGVEVDPIELGDPIEDRWSFRVAIAQPLLGGGGLANLRASRESVAALAAARESVTQDLRLEVTERWLELSAAMAALEVGEAAHAAVAAHLERVTARARVGSATVLELAEAKAGLAEAEGGRVAAAGRVASARIALASVVGLPLDARIVTDGGGIASEVRPGRSPAVVAADASARAASATARAMTAALWPRVDLRGGYQYENPNQRYFPLTDEWNDSWDVAVVAAWTLDAGVTWNESGAARASASSAAASARALDETMSRRAAQQDAALRTAEASIVAADGRLTAAQAARDATVMAFNVGAATTDDVLDREADLAGARVAVLSAHLALDVGRARLAHVHGTL
ncbi:MAG: TolC family protein [Pseudomonadota bacterium]|nr:TolC family protein [Pseudomonadota bacterium]